MRFLWLALALLVTGCAVTHPPLVCQAAQAGGGTMVLLCQPISPSQIEEAAPAPPAPPGVAL
jgi:hypothetical protein